MTTDLHRLYAVIIFVWETSSWVCLESLNCPSISRSTYISRPSVLSMILKLHSSYHMSANSTTADQNEARPPRRTPLLCSDAIYGVS
jgi:hypothetical protein